MIQIHLVQLQLQLKNYQILAENIRKPGKKPAQQLDYKTWLDFQSKRDSYLEKWDNEESRALSESIGPTEKAMISEFKLKVGESTRG